MTTADGRMSTREWFESRSPEEQLRARYEHACAWRGIMQDARNEADREAGVAKYQGRIDELKAQALLLGISLGE